MGVEGVASGRVAGGGVVRGRAQEGVDIPRLHAPRAAVSGVQSRGTTPGPRHAQDSVAVKGELSFCFVYCVCVC